MIPNWFLFLFSKLTSLRGEIMMRYLNTYVKFHQESGNLNKINVLLSQSNINEARQILKWMYAQIAEGAYIDTHLLIHNASPNFANLSVGEKSYIGKDCFLDLSDQLLIEDHCTVAMRTTILTHFDPGSSNAWMHSKPTHKRVRIYSGAYLGAASLIRPGVSVHEQSIVAAGAVVTKDVPPRVLVGGVPAHIIRTVDVQALE